jgi:hypothetical protein
METKEIRQKKGVTTIYNIIVILMVSKNNHVALIYP